MSVFTSSCANGFKALAQPDLPITVRNTFIEIHEGAGSARRCSSAPASPRDRSAVLLSAIAVPATLTLRTARGVASSSEEDKPATTERSTSGSASPLRWSDAESDLCTDSGDDIAPLSAVSFPQSSPTSSAGGGRTPLSSKAKAWQSFALAPPPPDFPPAFRQRLHNKPQNRFRQECGQAVEEARLALQLSGQGAEEQTFWQERPDGGSACTLKVVLPPGAAPPVVEKVHGLVQQALVVASSRLNKVHLMGCMATPFARTTQGFVCTLGEMREEKHACWDLYGRGFCYRGHACRWQHAPRLTTFSLVVVAARP